METWDAIRARRAIREYDSRPIAQQDLDRILEAEGDSTNNYKVSKQADVLMLFYLFSAESLAGELMSFGSYVEVVAPQEVRDVLAEWGRNLVDRYGN